MPQTNHHIHFENAEKMPAVKTDSVDLVVTSPPYPMIAMWDDCFAKWDARIGKDLEKNDGLAAHEKMHCCLDKVWQQLERIVQNGGFVCINIGDAVRTINDHFRRYTNHARITAAMEALGFTALPGIIWRKPTNAPNKFMGSGMLPAGAYVTLEHEHILIFRKGGRRTFSTAAQRKKRQESAFFWEERNIWFSDVWFGLIGTPQKLKKKAERQRSGAFPFELAYRLIQMYSVAGDLVLDPFLGTGTTTWAAMVAGRNSVGYEREQEILYDWPQKGMELVGFGKQVIDNRLRAHQAFISEREAAGKTCRHANAHYDFPVVTAQEKRLRFNPLTGVKKTSDGYTAEYLGALL